MIKKALLIVDHGSRKKAANDMIFDVVDRLRLIRPDLIIEGAHMELEKPDIQMGIDACVDEGATDITIQPFMLSPGRHSTQDIPDLVEKAMCAYPDVLYQTKQHFGMHSLISSIIFDHAGF